MEADGRIFPDIWSRKLNHYYLIPGPIHFLLIISRDTPQAFSPSYLRVIGLDVDDVYNTSNYLRLDQDL